MLNIDTLKLRKGGYRLCLVSCLLLMACSSTKSTFSPDKDIIDRRITFDDQRIKLSLDYIEEHYGYRPEYPSIQPKIVVVHHTVIPTWEKTFDTFNPTTLASFRKEISSAGALNVSSQYVVDRDGTIYRLMPDTLMARHVIGLNHCSIGIENVGGTEELPLTEAQLDANAKLVEHLAQKYKIEYLIGHHEYQAFKYTNHPLWKELDDNYLTNKSDPGDAFMSSLRGKLKKLDLMLPPEYSK